MANDSEREDIRAIRAIIDRQFQSLDWSRNRSADWSGFVDGFHADARLFPSARPVVPTVVNSFVERMKGLSQRSLHAFKERVLGSKILVFGNVAVALVGFELTENDDKKTRGAEAILLIKDDGSWKIPAQGWDMESAANPLPDFLLSERDENGDTGG